MQNLIKSLLVYKNPKILAVLFLGFASGLPLPLTGATLDAVLNQAGVAKTAIGLFALISVPYSLKFLWAPIIDRVSIPILTGLIGRRRSWIILTQISLIASIIMLGFSNPAENILHTAMLALWVAFSSASQDIVIDAYRIESLKPEEQGAGASASTTGYIISMKLIGGAMAFWLSDLMPWAYVYATMAAMMALGIIAVMVAGEPETKENNDTTSHSFSDFIRHGVIAPFVDFARTPGWFLIIAFIIFYKFGDAFAGKMTTPFLQDVGFTNSQIAFYLKSFGLGATLLGTFFGGVLVYKLGTFKALFVGGILQMASNLMFVLLAHNAGNTMAFAATVAVENLSGGMGTAAFVAYLSGLCNVRYTATQYALLSSLAATGRTFLSASSGIFAQSLGWSGFFLLSTAISLPGIAVLLIMAKMQKIK